MTREEAITIIGNLEDKDILFNPCDVQDAKTMAINALTVIDTMQKIVDGDVDTIIAVLKGEVMNDKRRKDTDHFRR